MAEKPKTDPTNQPQPNAKPKRLRSKSVPENETPEQKFKRLAEHRVGRAIKIIGQIGNLGNRRNYTYNELQAEKIMQALNTSVNSMCNKFLPGSQASTDSGFTL